MRTVHIVLALATLVISSMPARAALEPIPTERLAQQLREAHYARIGVEGQTFVLTKPQVDHDGLGCVQVREHPRRRAIVPGAEVNNVALPRNPVAWSPIDRIETGTPRQSGPVIGAVVGLVYGVMVGAGVSAWAIAMGGSAERPELFIASSGAVFSVVGAGVGALFPTKKWKQVYPESDETQQPSQASALDQQLREADEARIVIEGHTYPLIHPEAGAEGLAYESVPGSRKRRPALLVGADWDSAATPPNPIPWSQIDRIETGTQVRTSGTRIGSVCGLALAIGSGVGLMMLGVPPEAGAVLIVGGSAVSAVAGALIGSMFDTTRWNQVYPDSKKDER